MPTTSSPIEPVKPLSQARCFQASGRYSLWWGSALGTYRALIPSVFISRRRAANLSRAFIAVLPWVICGQGPTS